MKSGFSEDRAKQMRCCGASDCGERGAPEPGLEARRLCVGSACMAWRWDFDDPCSWEDVLQRWRARGPRNAEMVAQFQEEFHQFRKTHPNEN